MSDSNPFDEHPAGAPAPEPGAALETDKAGKGGASKPSPAEVLSKVAARDPKPDPKAAPVQEASSDAVPE